MIAGDEVGAVACGQPGQWRCVQRQFLYLPVDQITGHGDQVRLQTVDAIDDLLDEAAFDRRSDMHIADLSDRKAVQFLRKIAHGDVDGDDVGAAARNCQSHQRDEHGE